MRLAVVMGSLVGWGCCIGSVPAQDTPQLVVWEWQQLLATKAALATSPEVQREVALLRDRAEAAVKHQSHSVTSNTLVPPSGDKHDYQSFGAYWWPDPTQHDGLPFIRRDGQVNQEQRSQGDKDLLNAFVQDIEALSLAYFFSEDERYAKHAVHLIEGWFLNDATRMNPHLEYAQAVPGRNHGKNSGLIDTRDFIFVLEALALLEQSPHYNQELEAGLRDWFTQFLVWLQTSDHGRKECAAPNNHGSWYHAQVMRIALFLGKEDTAREMFEYTRDQLIPAQIKTDGTQPEELARTNSLHYSVFNLEALCVIARMGEALNYDLWHYRDSDGRGIQLAAEYLLPYLQDTVAWPYQQISKFRVTPLTTVMFRILSQRYANPAWLELQTSFPRWFDSYDYAQLVLAAYQEHDSDP